MYRISYKIVKKGKPFTKCLPFWYPKTQGFRNYVELWSIAVNTGLRLIWSN